MKNGIYLNNFEIISIKSQMPQEVLKVISQVFLKVLKLLLLFFIKLLLFRTSCQKRPVL
jgi:hypothetical protein